MIWHPMLLAAMAADVLGLFLYGAAALGALRISLNWSADATDRRQLDLEVRSDGAVIQARWALALSGFSFVLLLIGISNIFAGLIPGAMCGMGVMQSMGPDARSALVFRCVLLGALLLWNELEKLNRSRPNHPLTPFNSRVILAVTPVMALALFTTYRAVLNVDVQQPVTCCAVVYDQFRSLGEARRAVGIDDRYWIASFLGLSGLLLIMAVRLRRSAFRRSGLGMVLVAGIWLPVAAVALVNILSAYHYEVLQHHCPWCLFLPEHHLVGYPLFAAMGIVVFETASAYLLPKASKSHPALESAAYRRSRKAAGRVLMATVLFLALSGLPAVIWRLRFGTWMG
jgi:hypothetical protein